MKISIIDFDGVKIRLDEHAQKSLTEHLKKMSNSVPLGSILETDQNGLICRFQPASGMSWDSIFFIQNIMIQQRLALMDDLARKEGIIQ